MGGGGTGDRLDRAGEEGLRSLGGRPMAAGSRAPRSTPATTRSTAHVAGGRGSIAEAKSSRAAHSTEPAFDRHLGVEVFEMPLHRFSR